MDVAIKKTFCLHQVSTKTHQRKLFFLLCFILALYISAPAQKKRKDKKQKNKTENAVSLKQRLSSEASLIEAERYFLLEDYIKAISLYEKAIKKDSNNAAAYFRLSQIYLSKKKPQQSLNTIKKALSLDETNQYYYHWEAKIYAQMGMHSEVAQTYQNLIKHQKEQEPYYLELIAFNYVKANEYRKAIEAYDELEKQLGQSEELTKRKQNLYLKQSDLKKALKEGEKLINEYPDDPGMLLINIDILISNNKIKEAQTYVEKAAKKFPDYVMFKAVLAHLYLHQGDENRAFAILTDIITNLSYSSSDKVIIIQKALDEYQYNTFKLLHIVEKLCATYPDDLKVYELASEMYIDLKIVTPEAIRVAEKAIDLGTTNTHIWQEVIFNYVDDNEYNKIIEYAQQAIELFPTHIVFRFYLASAYYMAKMYEQAALHFEHVVQTESVSIRPDVLGAVYGNLGDVYNELKQYAKSDSLYELSLAITPDSDIVLNNYAYFLSLREENLEKAKSMSKQTILRNPDNPTYLDTYAWVLYKMKNYEEAEQYMEKVISISEEEEISSVMYEHYGDVLYRLEKVDAAVEQWKKALKKGDAENEDVLKQKITQKKINE